MKIKKVFQFSLPFEKFSSLGAVSLLEDGGTGLGVVIAAVVVDKLELSEVVLASDSCSKFLTRVFIVKRLKNRPINQSKGLDQCFSTWVPWNSELTPILNWVL